jgi:hypothetical protein
LDQRQIWYSSSGHALFRDRSANRDDKVDRIGGSASYFPTAVSGWKSLSTDPAPLLRQIHKLDGGLNTSAEEFVNVGDALRETPIPPATRAALCRAVALIPGVHLMGPQTGPTGQPGWASATTSAVSRSPS